MRKKKQTTKTYFTGIPCKRGHISERYVNGKHCIECESFKYQTNENLKVYAKAWYQKNKETLFKNKKIYDRENPKKIMLISAKGRAKKNGLEFNLVESDIVIPKYCPIFPEMELYKSDGKVSYNSPTLDRIDNNKGYVKGNIGVISHKANSIKRDGTVELFKRLIEYIESSSQEKN
jgi:hypothetical protein